MNYQDYREFLKPFNGIIKNMPVESESFQAHFNLIKLKIENFEVFKMSFMEHLKSSDWFPSHIEIYKHSDEIEKKLWEKNQEKIPLIAEFKKLLVLEIEQNDKFIANNDTTKIDKLRNELFETQLKIKKMREKYTMLSGINI